MSGGDCYLSSLCATVTEHILELVNERFLSIMATGTLGKLTVQRMLGNIRILKVERHRLLTLRILIHFIVWSESSC